MKTMIATLLCSMLLSPMALAANPLNSNLGKTTTDLSEAQYQARQERKEAAKKWRQIMNHDAELVTETQVTQTLVTLVDRI